ncbi:MAG: DMT family transporter [Xanthomonadales bacterium]|nr:DMT family transporter [Xanthomonadales bacterium]
MNASIAPIPDRGHTRGIACMLVAVAAFAVMDAMLKLLAPHYPAMQVAALRGLASLPFVVAWIFVAGAPRTLLRVRWSLHLLRGVLSVLMLAAFAFALRTLPLAEAYALFFVAPLLVTALAVPILGERVGWRRWTAILVGFGGVLIVLRPYGHGMWSPAGLAVLVAALAYALSALTVRVLGRTDSTLDMVFWMIVMLSAFALALAWPQWRALDNAHWPILAVLGTSGAAGQAAVTAAFRGAPASVVAPFEYTALAWGMGLDVLLWGAFPDATMLVGAAIIVSSGVYLIRRERAPAAVLPP